MIELLNCDCMEYMATVPEIAKQLGKQIAVINRMCKDGYVPHKTNARYLSDFIKSPEWFLTL